MLPILTRMHLGSCAQKSMESLLRVLAGVVPDALSMRSKICLTTAVGEESREKIFSKLRQQEAPVASMMGRYCVCTIKASSPSSGI